MADNTENLEFCDQCDNHCPKDALRCGRGRRRFGLEPERKELAGTAGLLQKAGMAAGRVKLEEAELFASLPEEDKAALDRILSSLLEVWKPHIPQHQHGEGHGDRGGRGEHGRHRE